MGKGSRLRRERAADREGGGASLPATARVPVEVLWEAVKAVGDVFGERPNCAEAAAVLQETASRLGYELTPRPVSVVVRHEATDTWAFMGPKASALLPDENRHQVEDLRPDGQDNGHLVLTCEDPRLLLDPNLRQLGSYGIDAPSLALRIKSTTPEDGAWSVDYEGLQLMYLLDEDHRVLLTNYDAVRRGFASEAAYLADMLRQGATADVMRTLLR